MNEITLQEVAEVLEACKNSDGSARFEMQTVKNNPRIAKIFYKVMQITKKMIDEQAKDLEQIKRAMTITDELHLVRSEYLCELDIFLQGEQIPKTYKLTDEVIKNLL